MNSSFWFFKNIFNVFQSIIVVTSKLVCPNCPILGHRTSLLQVGSRVLLARPQWSLTASMLSGTSVPCSSCTGPCRGAEAAISSRSPVNHLFKIFVLGSVSLDYFHTI